ncbi:hypothetical protein Tco_1155969 [Tanacetum coccineum]
MDRYCRRLMKVDNTIFSGLETSLFRYKDLDLLDIVLELQDLFDSVELENSSSDQLDIDVSSPEVHLCLKFIKPFSFTFPSSIVWDLVPFMTCPDVDSQNNYAFILRCLPAALPPPPRFSPQDEHHHEDRPDLLGNFACIFPHSCKIALAIIVPSLLSVLALQESALPKHSLELDLDPASMNLFFNHAP